MLDLVVEHIAHEEFAFMAVSTEQNMLSAIQVDGQMKSWFYRGHITQDCDLKYIETKVWFQSPGIVRWLRKLPIERRFYICDSAQNTCIFLAETWLLYKSGKCKNALRNISWGIHFKHIPQTCNLHISWNCIFTCAYFTDLLSWTQHAYNLVFNVFVILFC